MGMFPCLHRREIEPKVDRSVDSNPSILIVDDDVEMASTLADLLRQQGYRAQAATAATEVEQIVSRSPNLRLVLIDLVMPAVDGMTLLERLKQQKPELAVMMMSGLGTVAAAVEAVKRGAEDFITKPFERTLALKKIQYILELQSLREKVAELESAPRPRLCGEVRSNRHTDRAPNTEPPVADFPMFPLERLEKFAIQKALRLCGNNKSQATKILGISRESLYRKMRLHGVPLTYV